MPKVCPECGADLTELDVVGHANAHWPLAIPDKDLQPLALKRRKALLAGGVDEYPCTEEQLDEVIG